MNSTVNSFIARIIENSNKLLDKPVFINSDEASLSWEKLLTESIALASYFASAYPRQTSICVIGHKSPQILSTLVACALSGNIFVPIDSEIPTDRIKSILASFDQKVVLSDGSYENSDVIQTTFIADLMSRAPASNVNQLTNTTADEMLYIIFTSGSTGTPKGVPITMKNVETFLEWTNSELHFEDPKNQVFLNQAPFSFDLSVLEIYNTLFYGHTIWSLTKKTSLRPRELIRKLSSSGINIWVSTPSFVEYCLALDEFTSEHISSITKFTFCGEILHKSTVAKLFEKFPSAKVFNLYGPTEATCACTSVEVTPELLKFDSLPIARSNTTFLKLEPAMDNGDCELVISGNNVSPGYWKNPELNSHKFSMKNGIQSYRTGDLGFIKDEFIFFKGRNDSQIKLNGFRIELDEIINQIKKINLIVEASVLPMKDKEGKITHLVGFYVGDLLEADVKKELKLKVPAYMIPLKLIKLQSMPLNINGKLNSSELRKIVSENKS